MARLCEGLHQHAPHRRVPLVETCEPQADRLVDRRGHERAIGLLGAHRSPSRASLAVTKRFVGASVPAMRSAVTKNATK